MVRFLLIAVMCLWAAPVSAQQISFQKQSAGEKGKPIQIQSDKLLVEPEKNVAHFQGLVLARQADMQLASNAMSVFYGQSTVPMPVKGLKPTRAVATQSGINLIEVFGNVRLRLPDKRASADYGKYDVKAGKIHLVGDVILQNGDTTLRGKEFVYDTNRKASRLLSKASGDLVARSFTQNMDADVLDGAKPESGVTKPETKTNVKTSVKPTAKPEAPKITSRFMTRQDVIKEMDEKKKQ